MRHANSTVLRNWLKANNFTDLAKEEFFELDNQKFNQYLASVKGQYPTWSELQLCDKAAYRCLTEGRASKALLVKEPDPRMAELIAAVEQVGADLGIKVNRLIATVADGLEERRKRRSWMFNTSVAAAMALVALIFFLVGVDVASGQVLTPTNPVIVVASCGTPPATLPAAGSRAYLTMDTNGKLCVVVSGAGSGGTSMTDNAAFTGGSDGVTPMGAIYDNTPPTITDGSVGAPRMDSDRQLMVNCTSGCSAAGNTTGTTVAIDTLNETATVTMAGENGANVHIAAGTLAGTIVAEVSYDNGSTYGSAVFINPVTGAVTTSTVFTNPNSATDLIIGYVGAITHARIRLSAVTGGAANMTLRSVTTSPIVFMMGSDGTNVRPIAMTTGGVVKVDLSATAANATAVKVDGSAVTQPVSGTVTVTDGAGALNTIVDSGTLTAVTSITNQVDTNLKQVGGTNTDTNSGVKSAGTLRVVLATDQPALTNKLLVTPDSVALPANQSVNVNQLAGTTTDTNSGTKSAGTLRVVLATDQPALTNKLLVTPDSVALPANQSVNVSQINAVTPLMGAGNTGTGSPRVTISTDQAAMVGLGVYTEDAGETAGGNLVMSGSVRRDAAASSAGTTGDNATLNTDASGLLWVRQLDPCSGAVKTYFPVNIATATTTQIAAAVASQYYYICALELFSAGTQNIVIVEDDTSACASPTAGVNGGTTAATGYNLTAQTGIAQGNGNGSIMRTAAQNRYICFITSAAVQVSGHIVVVAAP